jgi:hypothetical protein
MSFVKKVMLTPENSQTEIMRRQSDYKPPRSLSHWFIGQLLQTADAPHQPIGKEYLHQELLSKPDVVVTDVPYHVYNEEEKE